MNNMEQMDLINIASFVLQLANVHQDNELEKIYGQTIKAIAEEIKQLHQENAMIIQQNNILIDLLRKERPWS